MKCDLNMTWADLYVANGYIAPPSMQLFKKSMREKKLEKSGVCYLIEIYLVKRKQEHGWWKDMLFSDAGDIFTKFTGKNLFSCVIFNIVADLRSAASLKNKL